MQLSLGYLEEGTLATGGALLWSQWLALLLRRCWVNRHTWRTVTWCALRWRECGIFRNRKIIAGIRFVRRKGYIKSCMTFTLTSSKILATVLGCSCVDFCDEGATERVIIRPDDCLLVTLDTDGAKAPRSRDTATAMTICNKTSSTKFLHFRIIYKRSRKPRASVAASHWRELRSFHFVVFHAVAYLSLDDLLFGCIRYQHHDHLYSKKHLTQAHPNYIGLLTAPSLCLPCRAKHTQLNNSDHRSSWYWSSMRSTSSF